MAIELLAAKKLAGVDVNGHDNGHDGQDDSSGHDQLDYSALKTLQAKAWLKSQGVTAPLGTVEAKAQFDPVYTAAKKSASYHGKSMILGGGGRTELLIDNIMVNQGADWETASKIASKIRHDLYPGVNWYAMRG